MNNDKKSNQNEQLDTLKELGTLETIGGRHKIFCLNIIGEIEGHNVLPENSKSTKYEHVIPQLIAVEQDDSIKGMLVILNTIGGDVEAGLALAELISGMKKPTVSFVLGGGHSIGVPLAVSAKKSFIAPSATMTIHPVRTSGLVIGVPQTMNHFARMQERITNFVVKNSGITKEKFTSLMMNTGELVTDVGTTLSGEMAVSNKLIDSIGSLSEVLECLYDLIEKN
ncbi:MAG: ATP-dependent Clp protease proteolytic subunit [Clostridia bacterium]|nr:ATP-dependent Clp protease proteolytic subunit [Clostridia bacterium]